MSAVLNFAFDENLVRIEMINGDPWFVAADICRALHIKNPSDAVKNLDDDEKGIANSDTLGGEQRVIIICEAAVFKLAFTSRKPEAKRFTRWVAHEVLPSIRKKGYYGQPQPEADTPEPRAQLDYALEPLATRVNIIREARLLHGRARAMRLWNVLGLPAVPHAPATHIDEAISCLRHLLDTPPYPDYPTFGEMIEQALDDDENARAVIVAAGVRPMGELGGFAVANRHPRIAEIFDGTIWQGAHPRVLRRLAGVDAAMKFRFPVGVGGRAAHDSRTTFVPISYLDPAAGARAA